MKALIGFLLIGGLAASCGGATGGGSSTSSTDSSDDVAYTVQELIDGGIQSDPDDILDGTWEVYTYDIGSSSSVVGEDVEDEEIAEIEFTADAGINANVSYAKINRKKLNTFSAPPLFDYTEGVLGPKSTIEAQGKEFYMCDEAPEEKCQCADTDTFCTVKPDCDASIHANACVGYAMTSAPDLDAFAVDGLVDPEMEYEIVDSGVAQFIEFTLSGISYSFCGGTEPGVCAEDVQEDENDYEEVERQSTYEIKATRNNLLAIETDDAYVILKKKN